MSRAYFVSCNWSDTWFLPLIFITILVYLDIVVKGKNDKEILVIRLDHNDKWLFCLILQTIIKFNQ